MLTSKQKETISTLKAAYKKINSDINYAGVFLDVDSIISENQKGKSLINEISLHNKAIKSSCKDMLEHFKNKAQGDFNQLGWKLYLKEGSSFLYFSSQYATSTLGYFSIDYKNLPAVVINNKGYTRIESPIFRINFSFNNNSYGSYEGFKELLNRVEVKEAILKTYNKDNR